MPSSNEAWGIEVGSSAIKGIRLGKVGNEVSMVDFAVVPFKKVLTTPDLDADEAIRVGLSQFINEHSIGKATTVVSVPGHRAFARFAKLPPVEPKKIPDIVRFEAVQQIPFQIDQVEWDYQTFAHDDSPDVEVGIFAITRERIAAWLANFRSMDVPVHAVTLSPVAVYNALTYDRQLDDSSAGVLMLDIGTVATELIVREQGRIWLRTIPIGGNHFTEALVRSFKLSFSKAEKLKREAATSKYARQIFQAMRPVFVDLVQEIQKSLGYYQSLNRDAEITQIIGMGSTFRLPGLQKFLKQQLQLDFGRLDEFKRISPEGKEASTFASNTLSMVPAYGLALQGLGMDPVSCNLLPANIIRSQVWREKQKWLVGAAAAMLLAAGAAYLRLQADRGTFESQDNSRNLVQTTLARAGALQREWKQQTGGSVDPRAKIERLRQILDYRNVWPSILRDIDNALLAADPQPALLERDWEAVRQIPRDERRQIHVEQISTRFTNDDGGMDNEDFAMPRRTGRDRRENVVEEESSDRYIEITVYGWTTHRKGSSFLEETVVQWLKDHGEQKGRPYRINTDRGVLDLYVERYSPGSRRRATADTGGRTGRRSLANMDDIPTGPPRGMTAPEDLANLTASRRPRTTSSSESGTNDPEKLLPSPPMSNEDRTSDWSFTLKFRIDLLEKSSTAQDDSLASTEGSAR